MLFIEPLQLQQWVVVKSRQDAGLDHMQYGDLVKRITGQKNQRKS